MSQSITELLATINPNTLELVFSFLSFTALLTAIVLFDRFGLYVISRDLGRIAGYLEAINMHDPIRRMRAAEEIFAGPIHSAILAAWSNSLVRLPDGSPPTAIKELRTAFGRDPVILIPARRRMAELVPVYLLVIGVVGIGLNLLTTSARIADNAGVGVWEAALPSMSILSLVMVLCVAIWFVVDRSILQWTGHRLARLQNVLAATIPVLDQSELLRLLLHDQHQVARAMETFTVDLPVQIRRLLEEDFTTGMFEVYNTTIEKKLTPAVQSISQSVDYFAEKSLKNQTKGMRLLADQFFARLETLFIEKLSVFGENLTTLYDLQQKTASSMDVLQNSVKSAIMLQQTVNQETVSTTHALEQSREHLDESTRLFDETLNRTGEIAAVLAKSLEHDRGMVEQLNKEQEKLEQIQTKLLEFSNEHMQTMGSQTDNLHASLEALGTGYLDNVDKQMTLMQDSLYSSVDNIFTRFTDVSSTTFESIESRTNSLLEELTSTTRDVMSQMSEQVTDLGFFTREINSEVSALNDMLRQTTVQFGDQMRLTMDSTFQSFDKGIADLTERLSLTSESIRDAVEDLPAAVVALRDSLRSETDPDHDE